MLVNQAAGSRGTAAHRIVEGAAERFLKLKVPLGGAIPEDPGVTEAFQSPTGLAALPSGAPSRQSVGEIVARILARDAESAAASAPVLPLRRPSGF